MKFQQAQRKDYSPGIEPNPNPASDASWTLAQFKKHWCQLAPEFGHWAHPLFMEFKRKEMNADPHLTAAAFKVGIAIMDYVNQTTGRDAFPGIESLAKLTCRSISSVKRGVKQLERGHYRVTRIKKERGDNEPNSYMPILQNPLTAMEAGLKRLATHEKKQTKNDPPGGSWVTP